MSRGTSSAAPLRAVRWRHLLAAGLWLASGPALGAHAVAQFGEPRYPPDFAHFEYANPDAPKGGQLTLSVISLNSSFDKFNPFTLRGRLAPGALELLFDTLTINSLDEENTQYGVLAEDIDLAPDQRSATFRLRAEARFSDGHTVTAEDVRHSLETLKSPQASPVFRAYFSEVERVVVVDTRTLRFEFARPGRDLSFVAGSLPVFSQRWGLKENGERVPFDEIRDELPITSGPYRVERAHSGMSVTYRRDPDYWAAEVPARRGAFNFDTVTYKLYKDSDTQVAALRAGDFDFFPETRMRYWCCQFIGQRFDTGELVKEKVPNHSLSPLNGYVFNLRHPRFQDIRVRRALHLAYDWEWLNRMIFDDEFDRQDSVFANSPLAASGLPSPAELALLEPHRAALDPAVFGPMIAPPTTRPPGSLRDNFTEAVQLLADAGWHLRNGRLEDRNGQPFVIEVPGTSGAMLLDFYYHNLRKLGFVVRKLPRDPAGERARLRNFDFDFAQIALRKGRDPGPDLWRHFNSEAAGVRGSENVLGLQSPVVDDLLRKLLAAQTPEARQAAAHALDRVMLHGHYVLPWRYLKNHYLIYNRRLQRPETQPLYFGPYEWVLNAWWDGDAAP